MKLRFKLNAPKKFLYNFVMVCDFYLVAASQEATGKANVSSLLNVANREAFERSHKDRFANEVERKNGKIWIEKFRALYSPLQNLKI